MAQAVKIKIYNNRNSQLRLLRTKSDSTYEEKRWQAACAQQNWKEHIPNDVTYAS